MENNGGTGALETFADIVKDALAGLFSESCGISDVLKTILKREPDTKLDQPVVNLNY